MTYGFEHLEKAEMPVMDISNLEIAQSVRDGKSSQNSAPIAPSKGNILIRNQSILMCVKVSQYR